MRSSCTSPCGEILRPSPGPSLKGSVPRRRPSRPMRRRCGRCNRRPDRCRLAAVRVQPADRFDPREHRSGRGSRADATRPIASVAALVAGVAATRSRPVRRVRNPHLVVAPWCDRRDRGSPATGRLHADREGPEVRCQGQVRSIARWRAGPSPTVGHGASASDGTGARRPRGCSQELTNSIGHRTPQGHKLDAASRANGTRHDRRYSRLAARTSTGRR